MKRVRFEMADPVLVSGLTYTAKAKFAVRPAGMDCSGELWLSKDGISKEATSGIKTFSSTGLDMTIDFPVTMPVGGYEYRVFLDVKMGGLTVGAYEATEKVLIPYVSTPIITW